jgi:hypothetical protein
VNLVTLIVSALLAVGAVANAGGVPMRSTGAVAQAVAGSQPTPAPTATPAPTPYDVVGGGGGPT